MEVNTRPPSCQSVSSLSRSSFWLLWHRGDAAAGRPRGYTGFGLLIRGRVVTGLGIVPAHPRSAAAAFSRSPEGKEGFFASSPLLAYPFTPAVAMGIGGALVEFGRASEGGLRLGLAAVGGSIVSICSALAASLRLPRS